MDLSFYEHTFDYESFKRMNVNIHRVYILLCYKVNQGFGSPLVHSCSDREGQNGPVEHYRGFNSSSLTDRY